MKKQENKKNVDAAFYEDMLCYYAMNLYVKEESEQWDEIQRQLDATDIPDMDFDIDKLYRKEMRKKNRENRWKVVYKTGTAVAVVLIMAILSFTTVPSVRAAVFEFFYKVHDTHTDISFYQEGSVVKVEETTEPESARPWWMVMDKEYSITYLPEGFHLKTEQKDELGINRDYEGKDGAMIMYGQMTKDSDISVNTENAVVSHVDIHGHDALLSVNEKEQIISITWMEDEYFFSITFLGVRQEETLKVAESVK